MPTFIRFVESIPKPKTKTFEVHALDGDTLIGRIQWFGRWRKYSFFPEPDMVFEQTCLRDIAQFIDEQMKERREARR